MAKTRLEKIESIKVEIEQRENQMKKLIQEQKAQERRDRTKRLCKRMGLFESLLPDSIALTDEHFKAFLEKTIATEQSHRILDGLAAQATAEAAAVPADTKPGAATGEGEAGGNGARATG